LIFNDLRGVAVDLAKRMGIYEKICDMRTQLAFGRYVDVSGNTLHEEKGEKFGFRQGEDVEIIREDLVKILMDAIEGIPCYFNQIIDSIKQSDDGAKVHFKDGRTEHYDLIVGADGLYSATRRMVFDEDEYELINLGVYLCIFGIPNYLNLIHTEVQGVLTKIF
jgi:2-polyprenyl-6-methoxyphenol hydroxylase-like FAD-dependent oxidoreductase